MLFTATEAKTSTRYLRVLGKVVILQILGQLDAKNN